MRRMSHIGPHASDVTPFCDRCRVRAVRFHGAHCVTCREVLKADNVISWFLLLALVGAILVFAISSAYATHYQINNMRSHNGKIL